MKQVEVFRWMVSTDGWGKKCKPYATRHHMSAEDAMKRDPAAAPVPGTRQMRQVAEPGESTLIPADAPYSRRS